MSYNPHPWAYPALPNTSVPISQQTDATYLNYKKTQQFDDVGWFLQSYVVEGGNVTKNLKQNDRIDISQTEFVLDDSLQQRAAVQGIKLKSPNSTYFVDLYKGDYWVDTSHPPGTPNQDFLTLATVTTDLIGNVLTITDNAEPRGGFRLKNEYGLNGYMRPIYNVFDYGAKGDGIADDSIAIQKCIDDVIGKGTGGTIFFPTGVYLLKSLIDLTLEPFAIRDPNLYVYEASNIKFVGTGGTILKSAPPGNLSYILLLNKCTNIEISGIHFIGDNTGLPPAENNAGLGLENIVNVSIHDCSFSGFQGSYVVGDWIFNALVENCDFTVKSGTAFDHAFLQDYTVRNCRMRGNGLGQNGLGTQGFQVHYDPPQKDYNLTGETLVGGVTNNVTLDNNSISGFRTAVYFSDIVDSRVINNNIFNNFIDMDSNVWGFVLGNTLSGIIMSGIKIDHNTFNGNGTNATAPHSGGAIIIAAATAAGTHISITNNDIFDNKTDGVYISSANVTMRAHNNRLYNRSTSNQTVNFSGFVNLTNTSLVLDNEGFNPRSLSVLTPALPSSTTAAGAVMNNNPFPVTIYQFGGTGIHIINPAGQDFTIAGGNQGTLFLLPYHKVYFATTNATAWTWSGE